MQKRLKMKIKIFIIFEDVLFLKDEREGIHKRVFHKEHK